MTSTSLVRSMDYVRSYRNMMQEMNKYHRVLPRHPSKSRVYKPSSTVNTSEASPVFIPLFYAGEKSALGCWDKTVGTGYIKRRLDEEDRSYHTLELTNPRNSLGTFISAPKSALQALHITLPHLVIAMKNYRRNFGFDVLIMDSNAYRRRFSFATWYNPSSLKKFSFLCQVPLRLEIGWNEIHVNFNELVKTTYKTTYVETIRVQIYSNCKLRQVFYCDDRVIKGDVPIPSMRDFGNIRIIPPDYGPRTHPDNMEPGPDKKRSYPHQDPPAQVPPTRLENDLRTLQRKRFTEVSKQRLALQPYKTYFRDLLHEEKQKKKIATAIQSALKEELAAKTIKTDDDNGDKLFNGNGSEFVGVSIINSSNSAAGAVAAANDPSVPGASGSTSATATAGSSSTSTKNIFQLSDGKYANATASSVSVMLTQDKEMNVVKVDMPPSNTSTATTTTATVAEAVAASNSNSNSANANTNLEGNKKKEASAAPIHP